METIQPVSPEFREMCQIIITGIDQKPHPDLQIYNGASKGQIESCVTYLSESARLEKKAAIQTETHYAGWTFNPEGEGHYTIGHWYEEEETMKLKEPIIREIASGTIESIIIQE